jgi:hypothetical protein
MNVTYTRPTCEHDYTWEQEYELQKTTVMMAVFLNRAKIGVSRLLPLLGVFAGYKCAFVKGLGRGTLGRYVDGTSNHPYIALSWSAINRMAEKHDIDHEIVIETTIVHELGHALQEALGLETSGPKAEDQAERLAKQWHDTREVDAEFAELLTRTR